MCATNKRRPFAFSRPATKSELEVIFYCEPGGFAHLPSKERSRQDRFNDRLHGRRQIIARLEAGGNQQEDQAAATAADLLWTITSLRTWEDLVLQRKWTPAQYQRHITRVLLAAITRTDAT